MLAKLSVEASGCLQKRMTGDVASCNGSHRIEWPVIRKSVGMGRTGILRLSGLGVNKALSVILEVRECKRRKRPREKEP